MKFLITVMATFVLVANAGLTSPTCEVIDTPANTPFCTILTPFKRCVPKGMSAESYMLVEKTFDVTPTQFTDDTFQRSSCDSFQNEACGADGKTENFCSDLMGPFCARHNAELEVSKGCKSDIECDDYGARFTPATVCCSFIEANAACVDVARNTVLLDLMELQNSCSRNSLTCFTPTVNILVNYDDDNDKSTNPLIDMVGILGNLNGTDSSAPQTQMMFVRMLFLVMTMTLGVWYY
jgi:hypothetical protein